MKKSIIVAGICLIVVVAIVGALYAAGTFNQKSQTSTTTITFGLLTGDLNHLSYNVAQTEGYYAQDNITVTTSYFANGPALMQQFIAGDLDFAIVGVVPAMTYRANALSSSNATALPVVIGSASLQGSSLVVNSKIQSIADLNGTTIATPGAGTIQDILLSMLESQNNITVVKDPMQNSNMAEALSTGEIDGFISWEPYPANAVATIPGAKVLVTSGQILPNLQCCVLIVSDKYLAAHPNIVSEVVSIQNQAINFINSNPTQDVQIGANESGFNASIVSSALQDLTFNQTVNVASMETFLSFEIQSGVITTLNQSQIDSFMNGLIDSQYVQQ